MVQKIIYQSLRKIDSLTASTYKEEDEIICKLQRARQKYEEGVEGMCTACMCISMSKSMCNYAPMHIRRIQRRVLGSPLHYFTDYYPDTESLTEAGAKTMARKLYGYPVSAFIQLGELAHM